MEATEAGILILVDSEINLSISTSVILKVKGPTDPTPRDLTMTVAGTPNFAERVTLSTDFPVDGNYLIQLEATFSASITLLSPVQLLHVGQRL